MEQRPSQSKQAGPSDVLGVAVGSTEGLTVEFALLFFSVQVVKLIIVQIKQRSLLETGKLEFVSHRTRSATSQHKILTP